MHVPNYLFLFSFYQLILILLNAYEKYFIWRFKIDHLYKIRQFQLDRFLLKLFGKAILGIKRSISKEIWAKIEWMIIEFQSICELLTWFLLSVKCKRKRKKEKMDRDRNIESHLPLHKFLEPTEVKNMRCVDRMNWHTRIYY